MAFHGFVHELEGQRQRCLTLADFIAHAMVGRIDEVIENLPAGTSLKDVTQEICQNIEAGFYNSDGETLKTQAEAIRELEQQNAVLKAEVAELKAASRAAQAEEALF